ncbi:MAG TPA: DUF1028 domain-containing protein [Bacillota bacterium]|nr:DUF1028 domain-containing protein [Bacillota bacterium]
MVVCHTFSIVAKCPRTNELGVAVATALPAVGSLVPYVRANVGAIATQAFVNPYAGINGLRALESGQTAEEALTSVVTADKAAELRQISIVDVTGEVAIHTGEKCPDIKGSITGKGYAIAGNLLANDTVLENMQRAFLQAKENSLTERLIRALEAGERAGGDKRGKQSAALYVVRDEPYPLMDIRVDEHDEPVTELRRVLEITQEKLSPFIAQLPSKNYPSGRMIPRDEK